MLKDIRNRRDFGLNGGKWTEEILSWIVANILQIQSHGITSSSCAIITPDITYCLQHIPHMSHDLLVHYIPAPSQSPHSDTFFAFCTLWPTSFLLQETTGIMHPVCVNTVPLWCLKQLMDVHKIWNEHQATEVYPDFIISISWHSEHQHSIHTTLRKDQPHNLRSWHLSANWSLHSNQDFYRHFYSNQTQRLIKYWNKANETFTEDRSHTYTYIEWNTVLCVSTGSESAKF